ncbi:type II toxin-antitoxin system HicA family toxin [Estrella lausannensis]|uniref:Uncharacterized protein n=1 Tax=Estrella lausannensis TaxID=483423 RepID=A0A0H5DTF3_9BACT|nr:hypothetical protein [Estrella lausannensis]CRX39114.1 hypothetical protein ELAC_1789 [Estrella lausannensis]
MEPTQRAQGTGTHSGSGQQLNGATAPSLPTPVAISLSEGGSFMDFRAVEINGNEDIEEVVRRAFEREQDEQDEVMFFCSDPFQIMQMQMRIQREFENRQEQEAHDIIFKDMQFTVKKQQKPWKNHQAKGLRCFESTLPLPLSKIPQALVRSTKGLASDEVTLLRACLTQVVFDCLDLKELSRKGAISIHFPLDTFITAVSVVYSAPKLLWDHQNVIRKKRQNGVQITDTAPIPVSAKSTVLLMRMLLDTMQRYLKDALPGSCGKSKNIFLNMLEGLSTVEGILVKEDPFSFANLRSTLGSICHDTKDPLFHQAPLDYLRTAKDMLFKVKKFTCHTLDAWKCIGGVIDPVVEKRVEFALRRIEQAIKLQMTSPQQLLNLYKSVINDLMPLKIYQGQLLRLLPQLAHHLAPFWGISAEDLRKFMERGEAGGDIEVAADEVSAMETMYSHGLVKLAMESIDMPSYGILRAFERSLVERGIAVSDQKIDSFKQCAENILTVFEELCSKHPELQEKVFKIFNENCSLLDLIEHQRDELAIISEVRLGAFASAEKVYYFGSVLIERFEEIFVPFLKYKTKALVEKLPKFSQGEGGGALDQGELDAFGKLLSTVEEFLHVIETQLPVLEDKLGEMFDLSPKVVKTHSTKGGKKPVKSKRGVNPKGAKKTPPLPKSARVITDTSGNEGTLRVENTGPQPIVTPSNTISSVQNFSSNPSLMPESSEQLPEKRAEVVIEEFTHCRQQFLRSAKNLDAHITEAEKQEIDNPSADSGQNSLRNVYWKQLAKELTVAGWALVKAGGGHLQYKHPAHTELGRATIPSGSKDALSLGVVKNVRQQISQSLVHKQEKK